MTDKIQLKSFEQVAERLAAITPEQFVAPKQDREKNATFVCVATDQIKRLYTLRALLNKQVHELTEKGLAILEEADAQSHKTLDQLNLQARQITALLDVVEAVLWFEIRDQSPDLMRQQVVSISSDWSLCCYSHDGVS